MTVPLRHQDQYAGSILYHLVWTTVRCASVLVDDVATSTRELITDACNARGWTVLDLQVRPYYVHLYVEVWPSVSPTAAVTTCKRASAGALRRSFPQLRRLPSVWTNAYLAATEGHITEEAIRSFLTSQMTAPKNGG